MSIDTPINDVTCIESSNIMCWYRIFQNAYIRFVHTYILSTTSNPDTMNEMMMRIECYINKVVLSFAQTHTHTSWNSSACTFTVLFIVLYRVVYLCPKCDVHKYIGMMPESLCCCMLCVVCTCLRMWWHVLPVISSRPLTHEMWYVSDGCSQSIRKNIPQKHTYSGNKISIPFSKVCASIETKHYTFKQFDRLSATGFYLWI